MGNRWIWNLTIILVFLVQNVYGTGVIRVHNKFRSRRDMIHNNRSLSDYIAHDNRRHSRILSQVDVDLPLGGNGDPTDAGLYFASIGIGNPSNDYYVQVDTGSDIFWVNCIECKKCPTESNLGIKLKLYNPKASMSAKLVTCKQDFCSATYDGGIPGCTSDMLCEYRVVYGDGSSTDGYFVNDIVQYDQHLGIQQPHLQMQTSHSGQCGAKQSGDLGTSTGALDGLLGFGQANTPMISQLAAAGKVKKMFAHCLDGIKGGGIFAIGQVVQPKVKTTSLVPNQYTGDRRGTIIDSGTTLSYLPEVVYEPMILAILSHQSDLKLQTIENQFTCFDYIGSVDDGFPLIKFHFEDSLTLTVYPHDYLFLYQYLALSDKLVVYDLENQTIGWIEYNCDIKMKDEQTGRIYDVASHDISSASSRLIIGRLLLFFLLTAMLQSLIQ
ncbi:hypothetical protein MKW92_006597 [Papaver armeniacum]|nr:hypothetical protein MKW92_006597 [Papaver armeniacum]